MVGAGGVVAVVLSAYFGRLPVLFWFMVAAFATAIGQAGSHGFIGFFVPRVMNGFFAGVAQGVSNNISSQTRKTTHSTNCMAGWAHVHQGSLLPP